MNVSGDLNLGNQSSSTVNGYVVERDVIKCFYILRGLFGGAFTHRSFGLLFDWFYPQFFDIIPKCLSAFMGSNSKIVTLIF